MGLLLNEDYVVKQMARAFWAHAGAHSNLITFEDRLLMAYRAALRCIDEINKKPKKISLEDYEFDTSSFIELKPLTKPKRGKKA